MKKRIHRALLYLQRVMPREDKSDPVSSLRICWYLQEHLEFDVVWDAYHPAPELPTRIDELWFVCSSWAFLEDNFRKRTLEIFPLADKVVWCNNDKNVPFHAYHLGRCRADARVFALTTVRDIAERFEMPATFDWNRLTWSPLVVTTPHKERLSRIAYYGSFRPDRLKTFDRYLPAWGNRFTMAAANGKDLKRFSARYPTIEVTPRTPDAFQFLDRYAVTPILEDRYAYTHHVSPPNRFYEALSAGTAMFFEPESVSQWGEYGYDVAPFVIPPDPNEMLERAGKVARSQARRWAKNFIEALDDEFRTAVDVVEKNKAGVIGPPPGAKRYI